MKRIFLTSGLVLCMACPTFAEGNVFTATSGTLAGECDVDALGTSTDGANVQLSAIWTNAYNTIDLDENVDNGGIDRSETGQIAPDPIYSVAGTSAVWTQKDSHNNFVDANKKVQGEVVVSSLPELGKEVTFTNLNMNIPAGQTDVTSSGGVVAATREFTGFYSAATGGLQMIDTDGKLTENGASNASAANTSTWYAQYACATPELTAPVRPGYTFTGWTTDQAGTTPYTACIDDTVNTLYAQWASQATTINFVCATIESPTPSASYAFVAGGSATAGQNATGSMTINMDASGTLASSCTLTGWTFLGWDCTDDALSSDAAGTTKLNGTITTSQPVYMKSASTVTCNAVWEQNTINLHWDVNNATTYTADGGRTCDYDGSVKLPTAPSRTGYQCGGWQVINPAPTPYGDTGTTPAP